MRFLFLSTVIAFLCLLLGSCGGSGNTIPALSSSPDFTITGQSQMETAFPAELPADALQPWEAAERYGSAIDAGSDFTAGRDFFQASSTGVSENGEAARIESQAGGSAYGIWRIPLGGSQPGTLSADVNLLDDGTGAASSYYIGLANYGTGRWDWHGPFADSHVRLSPAEEIAAGGNYLSSVQNTFVCVLASNGNSVDVVGLGLNPFDDADSTAPAQPAGLTATPVSAGLELQWNAVIASDLAGYRIYFANKSFINLNTAGVKQLDALEGSTRAQLSGLSKTTFVRITALDHSGNESAASEELSGTPLTGNAPGLLVTTDLVSGSLGSAASLTVSGADMYDIDTNGDGVFDVTGNSSGTVSVDTSATGIIRPRVRGTSSGGEAVALGSVSLIITGNSRPLASATASPQSGKAPLNVTFTGIAEDAEDDASALTYAWDFDGDGIYEAGTDTLTPPVQNYATPGIYGVKFRVTDSDGASDVDTVPVLVTDPDAPANQQPTAALQVDIAEGDAPLAVNFDASGSSDSDGSIVDYAWDWDGDGLYDSVGESTNAIHTYTEPGSYDMKLRVEDNDGGRGTTTLNINVNVAGNDLPVASLTVSPDDGDNPLTVTLDASASSDPDGSIVLYEWDYNGDGTYDGFGTESITEHTYRTAGPYTASVRITDNAGAQATATAPLYVNYSFTPKVVDADGVVGGFTSLIIVNGNPAISYLDGTNTKLMYVRATDIDGTSWGAKIVVDDDGDVGYYTSMAIVNGNPAISYVDDVNGDLKYVRATDNEGNTWAASIYIATADSVGYDNSLVVVNGNPAICYLDGTNTKLMYVRATDIDGTSWGAKIVVDDDGDVGAYTSMAIVNGNPAISYDDWGNGYLKYVRAKDNSGAAWDTPIAADAAGNVGSNTSLLVVDGKPAISYKDDFNGYLLYVQATDSDGAAWGVPVTVDNDGPVGGYASMALVDGNPAIGYYDYDNEYLKYVRAKDITGAVWAAPSVIDANFGVGNHISLAVVDGKPALSYYDGPNSDLKYARGL